MRIGQLAERAGVSVRAIRHYESLGLVESRRAHNGYREFEEATVDRVRNIRTLLQSGLDGASVAAVGHCLDRDLGSEEPCAAAIALYEERLAVVDAQATRLAGVRDELRKRLAELRGA